MEDFIMSQPGDEFKEQYISDEIQEWIEHTSERYQVNNILTMGNKQFGYRVRDEILFYMLENKINGLLDEEIAFDLQIMQKYFLLLLVVNM